MELSWHRGACPREETLLFANYHEAEVDFEFGETACIVIQQSNCGPEAEGGEA
jgi:hypothetical protein